MYSSNDFLIIQDCGLSSTSYDDFRRKYEKWGF